MNRPMKRIPIAAARRIAEAYGYDQVVIIARRVGAGASELHGEHVTTYGVNAVHCDVAATIGDFIKYKIMHWQRPAPVVNDNG